MTILNQTEIMVSIIPEKIIPLIIIALGLALICLIMVLASVKYQDFCAIVGVILLVVCVAISLVGTLFNKPSGRYQYECLIDDTVPYTEIYDKYDVVERRGSIWVLEDKEK